MEKVFNLIGLLPKINELLLISQDEPEALFIFTFVINSLEKLQYGGSLDHELLEESFYLIESLTEKMWEKINTGHFSEIPISIRKIYAVVNFFKITLSLITNSHLESEILSCYEYLDKAILIGSIENLYPKSSDFIKCLEEFLCHNSTKNNDSTSLIIEPIVYQQYSCDIPTLDCPSVDKFNLQFFKTKQPVLLRNTINHWPALTKWRDLRYLLKIAGNRSVPIEIGKHYAEENWSQQLIKLKDFIEKHFSIIKPLEIEYLAQHELFDQIPQLKEDIRIPDYCCSCSDKINEDLNDHIDIKAWLGPSGTISPMHQDPKNNILCQVFGMKKIVLASCDEKENLYPHSTAFLSNTSEIDAENLDFEKFPLVKNVKFYHLMLQEGECLYIPPKWWHFVKSMSKSFSVSFWWE